MQRILVLLTIILSTLLLGASHAHDVGVSTTEPYPEAPACLDHDPTQYHGLWNDVDGCHFDHTHNASPLSPEAVAIFGDYTQYTGQEVSYPWQTWMGATAGYPAPPTDPMWENDHKHEGYKFDFVDLGTSCPSPTANEVAIPTAWLIERHSRGDKMDFMSRVHSFWAAVRFCIPGTNEVAYLYTGGWQDFGQRSSAGHLLPLASNPQPAYNVNARPYIFHACFGHPDCRAIGRYDWNSATGQLPGHALFGFAFRSDDATQALDATGGFNQADPPFVFNCKDNQGNYVAAGCTYNNSTSMTYRIEEVLPAGLDSLDGNADGRINYVGYTDRWGQVVSGCTQTAMDCIPVVMQNLPVGAYLLRRNAPMQEYDIYFSGQPSGWIEADN